MIQNELLFFVTMLVNFSGILIAYKLFGKQGLFVWMGLAIVITNIEVLKCVDMFGWAVTLGNVIYGTTFLVTDILNEKYGVKKARMAVMVGFFAMIVFTVIMQVNLLFEVNAADFSKDAFETIFAVLPRIAIASIIAYLVANLIDVQVYHFIKKALPDDKWLWVRNNGSSLCGQAIDTVIFGIIAFIGLYEFPIIFQLTITSYILKFVITLCETPFLYIAKRIKPIYDE
jgi:conserved hypothetical integral membrane protein